jgi:hypothetical protein
MNVNFISERLSIGTNIGTPLAMMKSFYPNFTDNVVNGTSTKKVTSMFFNLLNITNLGMTSHIVNITFP